jgi:hypothetical protein
MLYTITETTHSLFSHVVDDPVRPEIPSDFRVSNGRRVMALADDEKLTAMVCISFHDDVPVDVAGLNDTSDAPSTVVFYTIWSYVPGAGRDLLLQAVVRIREEYPTVTRFVTLSPKTEMARRFHFKNGAVEYRQNADTVNYEYIQS